MDFMVAVLIGVLLVFGYIGYFIGWVKKFIVFELYKLNNVIRAICLAFMCMNTYAGLIVMLIV